MRSIEKKWADRGENRNRNPPRETRRTFSRYTTRRDRLCQAFRRLPSEWTFSRETAAERYTDLSLALFFHGYFRVRRPEIFAREDITMWLQRSLMLSHAALPNDSPIRASIHLRRFGLAEIAIFRFFDCLRTARANPHPIFGVRPKPEGVLAKGEACTTVRKRPRAYADARQENTCVFPAAWSCGQSFARRPSARVALRNRRRFQALNTIAAVTARRGLLASSRCTHE